MFLSKSVSFVLCGGLSQYMNKLVEIHLILSYSFLLSCNIYELSEDMKQQRDLF